MTIAITVSFSVRLLSRGGTCRGDGGRTLIGELLGFRVSPQSKRRSHATDDCLLHASKYPVPAKR